MAPPTLWSLDTSRTVRNLTWWWWWWVFFLHDEEHPDRSRQLMILWSTKNCDHILVDEFDWRRNQPILNSGNDVTGAQTFDGMTALWYYDGTRMIDPLALERSDLRSSWDGGSGALEPRTANTYRYSSEGDQHHVEISTEHEGTRYSFDLQMRPWNAFMSQPRFHSRAYTRRLGYSILRRYGHQLEGTIDVAGSREQVRGTAYFQKVTVNAPAVPWYWGVLHGEHGDYLDYFMPHIGLPIVRRTEAPTSWLDRGKIYLSRNLQFYHHQSGVHHTLQKALRIRYGVKEGLPTFRLEGDDGTMSVRMTLQPYSRACWRFQQRYASGLRSSILHYNEYPTQLVDFELRADTLHLRKEDLGWTHCNTEHAWGWLV